MDTKILIGDCIESMRSIPDESVHCCVTSPPYYGLRDYGCSGQIGLEETPEAYIQKMVEVFREARRVLRQDGTCWMNLGDSYVSNASSQVPQTKDHKGSGFAGPNRNGNTGLKSKDLMGIPWRVALALQQPYYTGRIKNELDRVWLAAMVDAEGSICGTEYQASGRTKTNIYISITNTSVPIIDKCERLFPQEAKHIYEKTNGVSNRQCFRWDVERMDTKSLLIREIYPYLVAKRKQAIIAYTFIEMQRGLGSKKKGYLTEQQDQRSWLMGALSKLNGGEDIDLPDWTIEPPSLHEPGFYLRQDIIWSKPNPMPESVTDRCTKSHEYIFLLSKSARYWYDAEAIKESVAQSTVGRGLVDFGGKKGREYQPQVGDPNYRNGSEQWGRTFDYTESCKNGRNKRSVWTVSTHPYKNAHFATFPPKLIEPMILAGCPAKCCPVCGAGWVRVVSTESTQSQKAWSGSDRNNGCQAGGGHKDRTGQWAVASKTIGFQPSCQCNTPGHIPCTVLDPFGGSGTTAYVANAYGRNAILCELNPAYEPMIRERLRMEYDFAPETETKPKQEEMFA